MDRDAGRTVTSTLLRPRVSGEAIRAAVVADVDEEEAEADEAWAAI